MAEWNKVALDELYDFASGLSKPRSEFGSGFPFLSFKDVFHNTFIPATLNSLVRSTERERQACSILRGDVFLTRTSETMDELGMSCVALRDIPEGTFNGFTKRLRPKRSDRIVPEYAGYYFRSSFFRVSVNSMTSMSTRASLNNEILSRLVMILPPISTQENIAYTLKSLDDKIELNRQMNETLEAMARAIFKDWFVDFGPTRAKMALRDEAPSSPANAGKEPQKEGIARRPYLAPDIWALFPDRLDDEGKPEGWKSESVFDQAFWINGAAYKDMHFCSDPGALPVIKIAELKSGVTATTQRTHTDLGDKYRISNGELLFSWSGNPETSIDAFIWAGGDAWLNQHIFAVRSNGRQSQAFLYAMLKFLKPQFTEIARNKQTTGLGHVTQKDLIRLMLNAPGKCIAQVFDDILGSGLIDQSQNATAAAMQMAEKKVWAHRS